MVSLIVLGWLFLLAGIAGGIVLARSINRQKELIAENTRLREALARTDTLKQQLEELRAMKSLLERSLLVVSDKSEESFSQKNYIPPTMRKSSAFLPKHGLPELSEYLENRTRIEAFIPSGLPADGVVSAEFGQVGGIFKHPHSGVDIVLKEGTQILSTADGIVSKTGENDDYGIFVEIDHLNGYKTIYGHLSTAIVSAGDIVRRNDIIGYSGKTGKALHPHIHYEVRYAGQPINPLEK